MRVDGTAFGAAFAFGFALIAFALSLHSSLYANS